MAQKVIVILGPTASGKTSGAIAAAKALGGEIVSCDSMQIYDEIHIGTARPLLEEQEGVPHHLMGFVPPNREYSASEFQKAAKEAVKEIAARGNVPILAGGTGLYINAITYDLDFTATKGDQALRERLSQEYDEDSQAVYARLARLDETYTEKIHLNDKRRIIRRLEILEKGGNTAYDFDKPSHAYDFLIFGISKERQKLYADIEGRVDQMFSLGLEDEARMLEEKYGRQIQPMQAIGYKEFLPYFDGEYSLEQAAALIKRNTRRFAKRQLTWFRRDPRICWINADPCPENMESVIIERGKNFLKGV